MCVWGLLVEIIARQRCILIKLFSSLDMMFAHAECVSWHVCELSKFAIHLTHAHTLKRPYVIHAMRQHEVSPHFRCVWGFRLPHVTRFLKTTRKLLTSHVTYFSRNNLSRSLLPFSLDIVCAVVYFRAGYSPSDYPTDKV